MLRGKYCLLWMTMKPCQKKDWWNNRWFQITKGLYFLLGRNKKKWQCSDNCFIYLIVLSFSFNSDSQQRYFLTSYWPASTLARKHCCQHHWFTQVLSVSGNNFMDINGHLVDQNTVDVATYYMSNVTLMHSFPQVWTFKLNNTFLKSPYVNIF